MRPLNEIRQSLQVWENTYPHMYAVWSEFGEVLSALEGPRSDIEAPAPKGKTKTSTEAALHLEPKLGSIRRAILDFARESGPYGITKSETEAYMKDTTSTTGARLTELQQGNWIEHLGRFRGNQRDRLEQVYVIKGRAI
jgi:hypothetical protein